MTQSNAAAIATVLARAKTDRVAAASLLPLVYEELRQLARARVAKLARGQTIRATELVHEAWMRVVAGGDPGWDGRAHFFGAAANAMRNILVDQARAKATRKRGGGQDRAEVTPDLAVVEDVPTTDLLALDEALTALEREHGRPAQVIMLRYFAGLDMEDIAVTLGVTSRTVERDWRFARAWLRRVLDVE